MKLQESGEMYLETLLVLSKQLGRVRSIDIAAHMGYSKPSVSRAVGILKDGGFIEVEQDGALIMTDEGRRVAEKTYERHKLLTEFLVSLGVSEEVASEDACKIEHVISDEAIRAIKEHSDKA